MDPRLKRFLRQARAVIAAERGLNAQSRLTLQSIAGQTGLPPELFNRAIEWLQQAEGAPLNLERYEKAFADYLDSRFAKLKNKILSAGLEERILERARRKYQVAEVRAQQIINHRATVFGISRISGREAEEYVVGVIHEKVGRKAAIDDVDRQMLHKAAESWGVSPDRVDEIILECLAPNREQRGNRAIAFTIVGIPVLLVLIAVAGYFAGWIPGSSDGLEGSGGGPDAGVPTVTGFDPADLTSAGWPEWWTELINEKTSALAGSNDWFSKTVLQIASPVAENRRSGYQQLVKSLVENDFREQDRLDELFSAYYFAEPDDLIAAEIAARIESALRPSSSSMPADIESVGAAFRANRLLARLLFPDEEQFVSDVDIAERKSLLAASVRLAPGLDPEAMNYQSYRDQSSRILAIDQWNHLLQTSWSAPSRAAKVVQPLYDQTVDLLERPMVNQFRMRSIESTLNADPSRFSDMQNAISEAIRAADEIKVQEWIRYYFTIEEGALNEFLGSELLRRCELEPDSGTDVRSALTVYRESYQNRLLTPVVARSEQAAQVANEVLDAVGANNEGYSPQLIAESVRASNAALAFAVAIESASENFSAFDSIVASGQPELVIVPAVDGENDQAAVHDGPTNSDLRKKNEMLGRLSDPASEPITRMGAFEQFSRVVSRFPDLAYADAVKLADYLLTGLELEEWLNVEKFLTEFAELPSLKIAIADRLANSSAGIDQILTLTNMLVDSDRFTASGNGAWKDELASFLLDAATEQLSRDIKLNPTANGASWSVLESYLHRGYATRLGLVASFEVNAPASEEPVARLAALIVEATINNSNPGQIMTNRRRQEVTRSLELARFGADNEMARLLLTNQVYIALLAEELSSRYPDQRWDFQQIVSKYELDCKVANQLGERLFLAEIAILRLLDLRRSLAMELRKNW